MEKLKKTEIDTDKYIEEIENNAKIEENKKTVFYILGIISTIIAVILIVILFCYYIYTKHLFNENTKETIEGIFISSGSLFTLSGVLLVIDNLTLQRKSLIKQTVDIAYTRVEIRQQNIELDKANTYYEEQNKLMQKQQNENTFFILLDLHKKLYNELNDIITTHLHIQENYFDRLKYEITTFSEGYINSLNSNNFIDFSITKNNPNFHFSLQNKNNNEKLEMYIENVKDIVKFIHTNLDNSVFYHNKFYNILFTTEKFLVGMCQELEMYDFYSFSNIKSEHFQYSKYYNSLNLYNYSKGYFPALSIELFNFVPNTNVINLENSNCDFKINLLFNKYEKNQIVLNRINVLLTLDGILLENYLLSDENIYFRKEEIIIDFKPVIIRLVELRGQANGQVHGNYGLVFKFVFRYDNTDFTVCKTETIMFNNGGYITFSSMTI